MNEETASKELDFQRPVFVGPRRICPTIDFRDVLLEIYEFPPECDLYYSKYVRK